MSFHIYLIILSIFYLVIQISLSVSYNIYWSDEFEFYESASRNPYTINMRGNENQSLVICFEGLQNIRYSGICEGALLDTINTNILFGPKTIFQSQNASKPYEMQIWIGDDHETGWSNYFLLAYTNGADRGEGPGRLLMGQYLPNDQQRIIYSNSQITFNPYLNDQSVLIELQNNNSYFIICASIGPKNRYDTACKIGKYDTETKLIGLGSGIFNISQGHTTHGVAVIRINSYTFLMYVCCISLHSIFYMYICIYIYTVVMVNILQ